MRLFILMLVSLCAFGMPEVRANESLEETLELTINYATPQNATTKRAIRPAPVSPAGSVFSLPAVPAAANPTGSGAKSLYLEHRVLRL